tara:strand:+ start:3504 stop:4388 length:885 start_codon:yes stop_codon:yes gene_type:complete
MEGFFFEKELKKNNCKIIVFLAGWGFSGSVKSISVFQNMLPYSRRELKKYNFSIFKIKMFILKFLLNLSFKKSNGIIFLSRIAKKTILTKLNYKKSIIIGHGCEKNKFVRQDKENDINFIYVSNTDPYKNHLFLIKSIYDIETNKKVLINFVGEEGKCHQEVKNSINKFNKRNQNIKINFLGPLKYQSLKILYLNSQGMIFCSTCENFPNIILEGMSYRLPILCPNISPLNEILEKNDFYYKVNNHKSLKNKMIKLIENTSLRNKYGYKNFINSKKFNWRKTSTRTFNFIEDFL